MSESYEADLFCRVGDVVEITRRVEVYVNEEETITRFAELGAIYKVAGLVEWGWDLVHESGDGPTHIRIINSQMASIVKVVRRT